MSAQMNSLLEELRQHLAVRTHEYKDNPGVIGNQLSIEKAVENIKKRWVKNKVKLLPTEFRKR